MRLKIVNLSKSYDINVLKDISLSIEGYKSVAIIGASGCGKSTFLRLLSGVEFPDNGSIQVNDYNVNIDYVADYQKKIGFVFQNHNLFPHLSLKRNISLILEKTRNHTFEEADEKAAKYLTQFHLEDQMHKLPKNVSGGQSQRASIARALSIDPEILLLDEPTASLDPILTYEVLEAIKQLKNIGKDTIFVTHEISFVKDFADYVIFMKDGKIVEHGKPEILDSPKDVAFREFMTKVK